MPLPAGFNERYVLRTHANGSVTVLSLTTHRKLKASSSGFVVLGVEGEGRQRIRVVDLVTMQYDDVSSATEPPSLQGEDLPSRASSWTALNAFMFAACACAGACTAAMLLHHASVVAPTMAEWGLRLLFPSVPE